MNQPLEKVTPKHGQGIRTTPSLANPIFNFRRHYRYNSSTTLSGCDSSLKFVRDSRAWYQLTLCCCFRSLVTRRQSAVPDPQKLRHREHQERGGPRHQAEEALRVLGRDAGAAGAPRLASAPGHISPCQWPASPRVPGPWSPASSAETAEHQQPVGGQGGQGEGPASGQSCPAPQEVSTEYRKPMRCHRPDNSPPPPVARILQNLEL